MVYVTHGGIVYTAHNSERTAIASWKRLQDQQPERVFSVWHISGRWATGDNPSHRYWLEPVETLEEKSKPPKQPRFCEQQQQQALGRCDPILTPHCVKCEARQLLPAFRQATNPQQ